MSRENQQTGIYFLIWLWVVFFPYLQAVGLKWQYSTFLFVLLIFTQPFKNKLYLHEMIVGSFSFFSLCLYLLLQFPLYFNMSLGLILALIVSRLCVNEKKVVFVIFLILFMHLIYDNIFPLFDYPAQFTSLNSVYGVNRLAFILFVIYFILCDYRFRYFVMTAVFLLTARFIIIGLVLCEFRRSLTKSIFSLSLIACFLYFFILEDWMINYYYFNVSDASAEIRLERYVEYLNILANNHLLPHSNYSQAPHNFVLEIILFYGLLGFVFLLSFFFLSKNRIYLIAFAIILMSPKTVHDLLVFYLLLGYFIKYYVRKVVLKARDP